MTQNRETLEFFKKARNALAIKSASESGATTWAQYETKWEGAIDAF